MEWADSLPEGYGHWIKSTDAQGNVTMIPAAQMTPTFQQKITPQEPSNREDEEKKKKGDPNAPGKKPKTTTTAPAAPTLAPEGEYSGYGASAGLPRATPNQPTVAPEPSDTKEREPGELLQPDTAGGATRAPYLSASTEPGPIPTTQPQSPEVERQSAADYRAQFAREHPTQGSMWTPGRPTPMAPPAPSQPPQQPSQQPSSAIQQVTDQPGVALANWQATTQTEPLTASDAMDWIKRQTTKAKHATYMPHGGPQGSRLTPLIWMAGEAILSPFPRWYRTARVQPLQPRTHLSF